MDFREAKVVELDVRPYLRKKMEPFQLIMDTVKTLGEDDVFKLHSTFKPTPLFTVLKMKGLVGKAEQIEKDHWISTFVQKKNKHWLEVENDNSTQVEEARPKDQIIESKNSKTIFLDNRGLEPPQPMVRTLSALEKAMPGDRVCIHNDRVPVFLLEELRNLNYPFTIEEQPDGSAKVSIQKI